MRFDPDVHNRRSIRVPGYDYSQPGEYFITICTHERSNLFAAMIDGHVRLSEAGRIVQNEWLRTAELRPRLKLDAFVVMPNHLHGIVVVGGVDGASRVRGHAQRAPTAERFSRPTRDSVPSIIRSFKAATTRRVNELPGSSGGQVWQRNYYEHIVRDEEDLIRIRQYIEDNPLNWNDDPDNPNGLPRLA